MGRQLGTAKGNGYDISYKYNDAGIRTQKTVNGVATKYHLVGDKVTFEENGTDKIYYTYDSLGDLVSMNLNGVEYYYIRNAQGDIIGLFDKVGKQVVSYVYDSWGKVISISGSLKDTVGVKNPYRYRGYRYDSETGLYYLNARYYNPEWGRFINADGIVGQTGELLSHNMFAYCGNNPINREDPSGYLWGFIKEFVSQVSNAINALRPAYAVAGGCELEPGPGTLVGLAVAGLATIGAVGYAGYKTFTSSRESTRSTPITVATTSEKRKESTVIYRSASGTNKSLTPRPVDVGGLSFYLKPPATGRYVVTTVQAVNATGVLHANVDGTNHCSVMPTNPLTMSDWIASRDNADTNPHPYTVILKSIVWDVK